VSEKESFGRDLSYEPEDDREINLQGPTDWQDPNVTSQVIHEGETIQVTRQLKVERVGLHLTGCIFMVLIWS